MQSVIFEWPLNYFRNVFFTMKGQDENYSRLFATLQRTKRSLIVHLIYFCDLISNTRKSKLDYKIPADCFISSLLSYLDNQVIYIYI